MDKDTRKLVKALERYGCEIQLGGKGHYKVRYGGRLITTIAATGSDRRGRDNLLATLRREIGFDPSR